MFSIHKNERGMTLIEIMIVLVIVGGLMAFLGTSAVGFLNRGKVDTAKIQIKEISKSLEAYNLSCNSYPTTDEGLKALTASPGESCPNWGPEPYMKKEPKDPWGRPFVYESDGGNFTLISTGKDRKIGGDGYDKDINSTELE
ncbi:MAG TPA: type II secretion system major pseudopilin GspG [Bdellovibrionales bacterium]|nr:type II secretion system major pseudopilin GspG [Bdellovibrionales bacterium]